MRYGRFQDVRKFRLVNALLVRFDFGLKSLKNWEINKFLNLPSYKNLEY